MLMCEANLVGDTMSIKIKLDIGCGRFKADGYIGVDIVPPPTTQADIVAPMDALPFDDDSVDAIRSSHSLEHVSWRQVNGVLKEWSRVIKRGHVIQIIVPDFFWAVDRYRNNQTLGLPIAFIFGSQDHEGEYHKTLFSEQLMPYYLHDTGLQVVSYRVLWDTAHQQQALEWKLTK